MFTFYSTQWFHINVTIPKDWRGEEVHFLWNANNEGMIWTTDGTPLQGLKRGGGNDHRVGYILSQSHGGEKFEFYLEMTFNEQVELVIPIRKLDNYYMILK
ncbi:hypothetical protein Glove_658g15 [Diversispora epigaea]|uniref:Alpha-mannosidase Ams1-like N-terminal domain-containing protein n=1 Tax=Diversispora epigaea TaxID=1348612 RepID=A0A397G426_9GLOM|nr:hypothetical protein Glove_658g15 [Diversispora epigaea]